MPEELIMFAVYGRVDPPEVLAFRVVTVWVLTIIVQMTLSRREARRNPNIWAATIIFYVHSYGIQFTRAISICEQEHNGDLSKLVFLTFMLIIGYLQGDMLEDCLFGDLNRWGGIWHNWSFFMPPYTVIILGYVLNHLGFCQTEHAWRDPSMPILDTITKSG